MSIKAAKEKKKWKYICLCDKISQTHEFNDNHPLGIASSRNLNPILEAFIPEAFTCKYKINGKCHNELIISITSLMMEYNYHKWQHNSFEQSLSRITNFYAWFKYNIIKCFLCGCFSKPTNFKLLSTTLSSTFSTLDEPDLFDIDTIKDINDNDGIGLNQQCKWKPDFKRYKDQ
ncbi:hypothetical protein LOAG_09585, partial [Loa loa]